MALLLPHTFAFSYLPHSFWGLIWVLLIMKAVSMMKTRRLNKLFSVFVVKLYGFCLSIAYIAHWRHPYIESLPTLWYFPMFDIPYLIVRRACAAPGLSSLTNCACDTRNWLLSNAHTQTRIILTHFCSCLDLASSFTSVKDRRIKMPRVLGHYLLYNSSSTARCGPTSVTVHVLLVPCAPNCVW